MDVDNVCRHADYVVRSLGTGLWKRLAWPQVYGYELGKHGPPGVWKKNFRVDFPLDDPHLFSTEACRKPVDNWASVSTPAGAIDLIISDGVFDRRIRSPARG